MYILLVHREKYKRNSKRDPYSFSIIHTVELRIRQTCVSTCTSELWLSSSWYIWPVIIVDKLNSRSFKPLSVSSLLQQIAQNCFFLPQRKFLFDTASTKKCCFPFCIPFFFRIFEAYKEISFFFLTLIKCWTICNTKTILSYQEIKTKKGNQGNI